MTRRSGKEKDIPVTPVRQTGNHRSTIHPTPKSNSSSDSKTSNSNQSGNGKLIRNSSTNG
jgi:hypothetical protein